MNYHIQILPRAQKFLQKSPLDVYERIRNDIRSLSIDPRPFGCKKLVGRNGWRIRIGQYRVVYEVNDYKRTVTVLDIDHRKDIYR